jgi:putative addiction module component (TIGR02574 family)
MASSPAFDYRKLSIAERLQLVEDIWDSIAQDADAESFPLTEEHRAILDKRLAEFEADPSAGASWPEVRARLLDRLR